MTREEAIEVYHGLISTKIKEAFEFFAPELRESEDERIRKVIYKLMLGMREEIFTSQDEIVTKEKVLAYLEKQKEPENVSASTMIPSCWAEEPSLQKEQPAEWSEEDDEMLKHIISDLREFRDCETDEKLLSDYEDEIYFLKSLPERFNLQPKQEWSEEDEIYLQDALWCVKQAVKVAKAENDMGACWSAERWLKSLRPSWKPSEEDIKMLEHIIGQYETGNKNSKVMGYLPRVEELSFLKNVLSKWKN